MKARCEDEIPLKWPARQVAGRPKKMTAPAPPRIPRITRLMALAIKCQDMIDRGEVKDYADLARLGFVTRARVTQIMNLTLLAPDIQETILSPRWIRRQQPRARKMCEADWFPGRLAASARSLEKRRGPLPTQNPREV
ncbi:MAG: hypothetical protein KatS3mg082_1927 [Nitrospiraceae bacterium]|nr:MAG: hypothetical protein KatS3mg082_1927 [Nitrospiraceae bacterium]